MPVKHGMTRTPTYKSWEMMVQRCTNPNFDGYPRYGGRGVTLCDEWKNFINFFEDMGIRPGGTTLDRVDVNGNFCKENCKWSNQTEQLFNQRPRNKIAGVYLHKASGKWTAQICFQKVNYHLGLFEKIEDAIKAREEAEMKYYGKLKPIASVTEVDTEDAS